MDYAQAVARVLANRVLEAKTTSARGTVTAISTGGYVTFTDALGATRKGVWVGDAPRVGEVITYLDEGRGIPLVFGPTGRPQVPRYPLFYTGTVSNGAATSYTTVIAQPSIMVAPAPMWMLVECHVELSGNPASNTISFSIDGETEGTAITFSGADWTAGVHTIRNYNTNEGKSFSMLGRKQYAEGETVGFHTRYALDVSTINFTHAAMVTFMPLD